MRNPLNFAEKTLLNILAKSSEAVLLLISSIVMVRHFSKSDYGTFLQIMLISKTMIMFTFLGLPQSIFYFFPQASNRKNFLLRNIAFSLCLAGIAMAISFLLRFQFADWLNNPLLREYGWVAPLLIFLRAPSNFREPILISSGCLLINSATTTLCQVIFFCPLIIAAWLSVSLARLLYVMLWASGAELSVYLVVMGLNLFQLQRRQEREDEERIVRRTVQLREQVKYALPIGLSSYLSIIGRQIDQYIVSAFFTPENFALYSRGAMRVPFLSTIQLTMVNVMMPKFVSAYQAGDLPSFLNYFHLCIEKVAKINFLMFSLLFAVAPSIMTLLYTEEYVGASSVFRVYLCILLTSIAIYGVIPKVSGQTTHTLYGTSIYLSSNIMLSVVFVLILGPVGAALATILAGVISSGYLLYQACRILHVSVWKISPWKDLSLLLGIALTASLPVYLLEFLFPASGSMLFWRLLAESGVYAYCCMFLMVRKGLIAQDELDFLTKWFRFDVKRVIYTISFFPE